MSDDGVAGEEHQGSHGTEKQGEDDDHGDSGAEGRRGEGHPGQQGISTVQKAVVVFSIGLTLVLFAYAGWQMVTPPQSNTPEVSVTGTTTLSNGDVAVSVRLRNPTDVGLVTATVESNCTSPPAQVTFSYVPASSTRTGTLVCPEGTTGPSVSLVNWVSK